MTSPLFLQVPGYKTLSSTLFWCQLALLLPHKQTLNRKCVLWSVYYFFLHLQSTQWRVLWVPVVSIFTLKPIHRDKHTEKLANHYRILNPWHKQLNFNKIY